MPDTPVRRTAADDIIVCATDGTLYSIPHDVYTDPHYILAEDNPDGAPARVAIEFGAVVANIPSFGTGIGGFCYLINLRALTPSTGLESLPPPPPSLGDFAKFIRKQLDVVEKMAAAERSAAPSADPSTEPTK
jgi:hypothetical protein